MLLIAYGLISENYYLVITIVAIEISFSFSEFLSPMLFGIGNEATSLIIETNDSSKESFRNGMNVIISGGLLGILVSLPLFFFAEEIYPIIYSALNPFVGWILLILCIWMILTERYWKKRIFAATIFCLSGLMGLFVRDSGLISSEYLLLPIFVGLYGFSSLISKKRKKAEPMKDITPMKKAKIAIVAFITTVFASLISGMKRGQTSALALQIGRIFKYEEMLFVLSLISLSFTTLSILVLGSVGKIRSTLAYDINEVMGGLQFSQAFLLMGVVAFSACTSIFMLILLAKPFGKMMLRLNENYLKIFGFSVATLLIINFTGIYGILLAFTATCIGILSSRFGIRSTHLMGVLLLPTIVMMIL